MTGPAAISLELARFGNPYALSLASNDRIIKLLDKVLVTVDDSRKVDFLRMIVDMEMPANDPTFLIALGLGHAVRLTSDMQAASETFRQTSDEFIEKFVEEDNASAKMRKALLEKLEGALENRAMEFIPDLIRTESTQELQRLRISVQGEIRDAVKRTSQDCMRTASRINRDSVRSLGLMALVCTALLIMGLYAGATFTKHAESVRTDREAQLERLGQGYSEMYSSMPPSMQKFGDNWMKHHQVALPGETSE